jgi:hypothetical protein
MVCHVAWVASVVTRLMFAPVGAVEEMATLDPEDTNDEAGAEVTQEFRVLLASEIGVTLGAGVPAILLAATGPSTSRLLPTWAPPSTEISPATISLESIETNPARSDEISAVGDTSPLKRSITDRLALPKLAVYAYLPATKTL